MNAMLLLVAILFGLIAVAGYNLVTLNQTFNISNTIQQNQARVQIVTSSLRTALTIVDGKVAVPVSASLNAAVPDASPFSTSYSGIPYLYCPILRPAPNGDARLSNASASESYAIQTVLKNGMTYAVAGRPGGSDDEKIMNLGVVAYVITPQPNSTEPLKCSDVRVADDGTTLLITGGAVSPVYDNPVTADGASFVISTDGERPEAAATSDRVVRNLSEVVEYVKHYDINDIRIRVFGEETLAAQELSDLFALSFGRTMRLEGPEGVRALLKIDEGSNGHNDLIELAPQGKAVISNVTLKGVTGSDVGVASYPGGSVLIENSVVARVRANGGEIIVAGSSQVAPTTNPVALAFPVLADGGRVVFDVDDSSSVPAILSQTSSAIFSARGGDVVVKSGLHAVSGSAASILSAQAGGRLRNISQGADILVDRGQGFSAETHNDLQRVTATCADGDPTCTAVCPEDMRVAWGECGSGNQSPLSGFSVDATGTQYTCQWAQMTIAVAPKAAVVCQMP
jgi:hypothetical protein